MIRPIPRLRAPTGAALLLAALLLAAPAPSTASAASVSSNWAGYVAIPSPSVGSRFSSVSGSWRQPSATCTPGRESYSAIWVGMGGDSETARSLEQIGTDTDCSHGGSAAYSSWFELLPAGPVTLSLKVVPGDQISASVTVRAHHVTLRMHDMSTGARFTTTRRAAGVDLSSAEWIVEAPSACGRGATCQTLPLTNFGDLSFSSATATARAHTGPIADPDWSVTALELRQSAFSSSTGRTGARATPTRTVILATPSSAPGPGGAFSVSWREQAGTSESPNAAAPAGA